MSSVTPHYRTIKDLLQTRSFAIDEYQREYKWEQKNVEELVSDLLSKFETFYHEGDGPKAASSTVTTSWARSSSPSAGTRVTWWMASNG